MNAMERRLRLTGVVIVGIVFCVPLFVGLGLTDLAGDEATHSYTAERMLETGDWLNPIAAPTTDIVFLDKPPLKFWMVALPIRLGLLPGNEFGLRFWDAAMGGIAFLYVFAIGRRMAGWFCGVVALVILYSFDSLIFTHGLRENNMDAVVVLAYAGAVYHFLRWADEGDARGSRLHALAVGLYFLLGFMSKFVAIVFLPMMLGGAALELKPVRDKVCREWRAWGVAAVVVLALAAPWFIYQMAQPDRKIWQVMLGSHVYQRFSMHLVVAHLRPWHYYFTDLFAQVRAAGTLWIVLAGGLLVHLRVLRERWLAGTVALYWFWFPFVLMSLGTSKLRHYTYPFLPAVALAGGYFMGSVANLIVDAAAGDPPPFVSRLGRALRVDRAAGRVREAVAALGSAGGTSRRRQIVDVLRVGMLVATVGGLALAAVALVYPRRLRVGGLLIVRDPSVWRPALIALALGILARRARWTARVAVPLVLLTLLPIAWYRTALTRVTTERHPLRTSRACMQSVRDEERAVGRSTPGMFVYLPSGYYLHTYFYYYRHFGWDWRTELSDAELLRMLDTPGEQRPILLPRHRFAAVREAHDAPGVARPLVQVDDVVLLLPGPYARCGL
jgi:4-amino-4-deoxy-L-arabinose transferase-like glycosyltransferase